jgi:hypothetical protein
MKICLIVPEPLFPTNSGGRLGILREVLQLSELGFEIQLLIFHKEDLSKEVIAEHKKVTQGCIFIKRTNFFKSSLRYPLLPYQYSSRIVSDEDIFYDAETSLILANHEWTIPLAEILARKTFARVLLRIHNDERNFISSLFLNETNFLRKLYFLGEYLRFGNMNRKIEKVVDGVVAITSELTEKWNQNGIPSIHAGPIIPKFVQENNLINNLQVENQVIGFIGALDMSHTRKGLRWFIENVYPIILKAVPESHFVLAGRNAPKEFTRYLESKNKITFLGEIKSPHEIYSKSSLFINPIHFGSGVNIKIIDPVLFGIPVVSTNFGLRGYSKKFIDSAAFDSVQEFSSKCIDLLSNKKIRNETIHQQQEMILPANQMQFYDAIIRLSNESN